MTLNDYSLRFRRRRYGNTTFTWAYVEHGGEWLSLGDPWQCARPAKEELLVAIRAILKEVEL